MSLSIANKRGISFDYDLLGVAIFDDILLLAPWVKLYKDS